MSTGERAPRLQSPAIQLLGMSLRSVLTAILSVTLLSGAAAAAPDASVSSASAPSKTVLSFAGLYYGPVRIVEVGPTHIDFELNPDNERHFSGRQLLPGAAGTRVRHWSTETEWASAHRGKRLLLLVRQDPDTVRPSETVERPPRQPFGDWVVFAEADAPPLYASTSDFDNSRLVPPEERPLLIHNPLSYGFPMGLPVYLLAASEVRSEPQSCGWRVRLRSRFQSGNDVIELSPGESSVLGALGAQFRVKVHEMSAFRYDPAQPCHAHAARTGDVHVTMVRL